MKLSIAIEHFLVDVCAGKTNETPESYRKKLKRLWVTIGDVSIESITPADLNHLRISLLTQRVKRRGSVEVVEPLSIWYVRGVLRTVKHFFRWCADEGLLPANPAARLKVPKEPEKQPKAIEQTTFKKLIDAATHSGDSWARFRNVAFLCLLRDTGGRLAGLLGARVSDLNLKESTLMVREKGNKMRPLFMGDNTRAAMIRWLKVRSVMDVRSDALFIGKQGEPLSAGGARSLLRRLAATAGVEGERYNPHSFRHAFARDTLRAGANLSEVSQMMGHSGIAITADYYARWLPTELRDAHRKTAKGRGIPRP